MEGDTFFSAIDTEEKAYLLGFIAFKVFIHLTGSITITVNETDKNILFLLQQKLCPSSSIDYNRGTNRDFLTLTFKSPQLITDICSLFSIIPGKKSSEDIHLKFPTIDERLKWPFVRGLFDSRGEILTTCRACIIQASCPLLLQDIGKFAGIHHNINENILSFIGTNAIDFLSKLYDTPTLFRLKRNYADYLHHLGYSDRTISDGIPICNCVKTRNDAVIPFKKNASDEGYDLVLIDIDRHISNVTTRYETGIRVQPSEGFHIEILPRSSLSNSGYMLSNSIGLIDESYRGTLKIVLTKVDPEAPPLVLPFKAVQMVLRKSMHFICNEVAELDSTSRNEGGFGSTNI